MRIDNTFIVSIIVLLLIAISAFVIISDAFRPHKYRFVEEDVEFVSDYRHPGVYLQELRERDSFMVSPEFVLSGAVNSSMTEGLTLFTAVLVGSGKRVISLGRVVSGEELTGCQTNKGDLHINQEISVQECRQLLSGTGSVLFLIALPDPKLERAVVAVYENRVEIRPKTYEDVARVSGLVLRTMFSSSEETIERVNALLDKFGRRN